MFPANLSTLVNSPMKFNVRSSFCSDSQPSRFSILATLFIARFKYSSFFNLLRFSGRMHSWGGEKIGNRKQFSQRRLQSQIELLPIFGIRLDCSRSIFSSRHQSWTCSIRSIFSWCNESSSRLKMRSSLCSDFLRINCSVTKSKRKHNLKYLFCFDAYFSPFRCFSERQQRKLKQTRLVAMV